MFFREGRIEIVFRQDERCGRHRKTVVLLFLSVRRRCRFEASARTVCGMLFFTLTPILAVMVPLYRGRHVLVSCCTEKSLHPS